LALANVYEIAVKDMFILSIEPIIHKGEKKYLIHRNDFD